MLRYAAISRISIHPPREGWDGANGAGDAGQAISIHPPREGWDSIHSSPFRCISTFQSTHPARGGTCCACWAIDAMDTFQSTHPARGGTLYAVIDRETVEFQSTHPARGGTVSESVKALQVVTFQSTHPARGGTMGMIARSVIGGDFNPPTPRGVGPVFIARIYDRGSISIHPPREGWDLRTLAWRWSISYFNPPTPRGVGRARPAWASACR